MIQVHLCVVYLFAGLGKICRGTPGGQDWRFGEQWANLEYQTLDMTWLAGHLALVNLLTFQHFGLGGLLSIFGLASADSSDHGWRGHFGSFGDRIGMGC
jgi:hypothetical protein